ncbi:hypothetical protein [Gordonia sp. NPDC003585]|uniref:hypothetical protein n=1 Tax=Gordonia sp. NPDC003585 TaxID=3154275 RepID=UPI0033BD00A0
MRRGSWVKSAGVLAMSGLMGCVVLAGCTPTSETTSATSTATVTVTASQPPGVSSASTTRTASPNPQRQQRTPEPVDPSQFRSGQRNGEDVYFTSPTGNIWCRFGSVDYSAGCQAKNAPIPAGADCRGNSMYPAHTLSRGFFLRGAAVMPACFNQGVFVGYEARALPYDHSISAHGYLCVSRVTGMTCFARSARGFVLSMQEARAF